MPKASLGISTIVIRGGTLLDESGKRRADVAITAGQISAVGEGLDVPNGATMLDAGGCLVTPGLVDMHTHLREPGLERAETVESGARAAALGGYTAVVAMPNTSPAIDSASMVRDVVALGSSAMVEVAVAGAITVGRSGDQLAPLAEMARAGVRLFTDDGKGVQDSQLMRRALEYARGLGVVLAQHCEDEQLVAGGVMNEGAWSSRLGLPGQPGLAEEMMLARDIGLVRLTGCPMHFLHLSTAGSVALVASARQEGLPVTAEVTPHHLCLTDAAVGGFDPVFKVHPPLRTWPDVLALRRGLVNKVIDVIATDHAPHPAEAKEEPFELAAPGILGLETAFAVSYNAMCLSPSDNEPDQAGQARQGTSFDISDLLAKMSWRPARLAGLAAQGGVVRVGGPANLTVLDLEQSWTVDPAKLASLSRNTAYAKMKLTGKARHTVSSGEAVVIDGLAQR